VLIFLSVDASSEVCLFPFVRIGGVSQFLIGRSIHPAQSWLRRRGFQRSRVCSSKYSVENLLNSISEFAGHPRHSNPCHRTVYDCDCVVMSHEVSAKSCLQCYTLTLYRLVHRLISDTHMSSCDGKMLPRACTLGAVQVAAFTLRYLQSFMAYISVSFSCFLLLILLRRRNGNTQALPSDLFLFQG